MNLFAKFKVLNLGPVTKCFWERKYIPGRAGKQWLSSVRAKHLLMTWFRSARLSVCCYSYQSALSGILVLNMNLL